MKSEGLFRKKAMERMTAPEQLNDYIRLAGPGVWLVLCTVIAILIAVFVWGVMGQMESVLNVAAVSGEDGVVCYVPEGDGGALRAGMTVRINRKDYVLSQVAERPVETDEGLDPYALHVSGLEEGSWVYLATVDAALPAGVYQAQIVTETVRPLSFLLN